MENNYKPTVKSMLMDSVHAGFKLANKENFQEITSHSNSYDPQLPDVISINEKNNTILIASGGLDDLLEDGQNGVLLYMTLDKKTPENKIDALSKKGGFFYKNELSGDHVGCIQLSLDKPIDEQLIEIESKGLLYKPYAFDEDSISLLPMFNYIKEPIVDGRKPEDTSLDDCSKKLTTLIGGMTKVFNIPDELIYLKLNGKLIKEKELETDVSQDKLKHTLFTKQSPHM